MKYVEAFLKAILLVPICLAVLVGVGALLALALAGFAAVILLMMAIGVVSTVLLPIYALIYPEELSL